MTTSIKRPGGIRYTVEQFGRPLHDAHQAPPRDQRWLELEVREGHERETGQVRRRPCRHHRSKEDRTQGPTAIAATSHHSGGGTP
jgi:hypothetical protein